MGIKAAPVVAKEIAASESGLVVMAGHDRYEFSWADCSEKLAAAQPLQRQQAILSPSGYGIHWPLLDEDIAVESLVSAPGVAPCPFESRR